MSHSQNPPPPQNVADPYVLSVDLPDDTPSDEIQRLRAEQPATTFVVGSRKSQLALIQTVHVCDVLRALKHNEAIHLPLVTMKTTGDNILDVPLAQIGSKSLFTKELEGALLNNTVDLVVHSLKDLPTTLPDGLCVGAVLRREDPRDAILLRKGLLSEDERLDIKNRIQQEGLGVLPAGSIIGTSSVRRRAQLKRAHPTFEFRDMRGNLNTRLRKLDTYTDPVEADHPDTTPKYTYDALILAAAGLHRLGWQERIDAYLNEDISLHAVGQGALAVECRTGDTRVLHLLKQVEHAGTRVRCEAERAVMRTLEGGCSVPIGVWTILTKESATENDENVSNYADLRGITLTLRATVVSPDGTEQVKGVRSVTFPDPVTQDEAFKLAITTGEDLAAELREAGADKILAAINH